MSAFLSAWPAGTSIPICACQSGAQANMRTGEDSGSPAPFQPSRNAMRPEDAFIR